MANKPCIGMITCPYCKQKNVAFWNGNTYMKCEKCHERINVKRQKMKNVKFLNT